MGGLEGLRDGCGAFVAFSHFRFSTARPSGVLPFASGGLDLDRADSQSWRDTQQGPSESKRTNSHFSQLGSR